MCFSPRMRPPTWRGKSCTPMVAKWSMAKQLGCQRGLEHMAYSTRSCFPWRQRQCVEEDSTMAQRKTGTRQSPAPGNVRKDPEEWTTGGEPMTAAQHSYLQTLCDEAGEPMDEMLTKAQAARRIDELQ